MKNTNLVLFDIDGTLCDSSSADELLFLQSLNDLFNVKLTVDKWNEYKNKSTHNDNGSAKLILSREAKSKNIDKELAKLKNHFLRLLGGKKKEFKEISGARDFLNYLQALPDYKIGIVTGSWRESGIMKLESIGIDVFSIPYGNADDFSRRKDIIKHVISEAATQYGCASFSKITYFGDGLWDLNTAKELGIDFIGVDSKTDGELSRNGAPKIINNYLDLYQVVQYLIN